MRKKIVAGNWKMNLSLQDGVQLAKEVESLVAKGVKADEVIVGVPFIHLSEVAKVLSRAKLASQNCANKASGAYTGEVSVEMIKSTGAEYVIIGHSERREYYNETSEILNEKLALILEAGLTPIYCCGEPLDVREANGQNDFVKKQFEETILKLSKEDFQKIVIAYEPIWAIGTGVTASKEQAQEIHAYIRGVIADKFGQEVADNTSILYGGSCNPKNAQELFAQPDIDGGLIGGASLKAEDFTTIAQSY